MGVVEPHVEKDGTHITAFPPTGDGIRDTYDKACSNRNNPWLMSDHDRHTREIQSVGSNLMFAQDHTHEVTKNCFQKKRLGANASWDVGTDTGEIACAVLAPSTKTKDFSHAAQQLTKRPTFAPSVMHSDTWPSKSEHWERLFDGKLQGRLGLFHCVQRITRTLKKKHADHFHAVNGLLNAICKHNEEDYERLLQALKNGTLSGTKCTEDDIADLKASKAFRQRCDRYLRKEIRPANVLREMLDDWFDRFKCSSSTATRPARGRLDPLTGETLFTPETREAVLNCKEKACYLQDPLPLDQMYRVITPSPNSTHGLNEYLSRRGESSLESFHLMLAHFGNCGMRTTLADNLNLTGTARHNLVIRHKMSLTDEKTSRVLRSKIPAAFEDIVSFFDHTELHYVNQIALDAGTTQSLLPFQKLETLPKDSGERFFSEYLTWMKQAKPKCDINDHCMCSSCYKHGEQWATLAAAAAAATATTTTIAEPMRNVPMPNAPMAPTMTMTPNNAPTHTRLANSDRSTANSATPPPPAGGQLPQDNTLVRANQLPTQQHNSHAQTLIQPQEFWPFAPAFQMPSAPPQWMYPAAPYAAPCQPFCCGPYRHWYNSKGRRGRPPHEHHCGRIRKFTG